MGCCGIQGKFRGKWTNYWLKRRLPMVEEMPLKRRPGRPMGSGVYMAHNALARAFWKRKVDWKAELAELYIRYRKTGKKNALESLRVWIALLPYLSLTEKYRADKKLGKFGKKPKVSKRAVAALQALEAEAGKPRKLTYDEQATYAPDPQSL